MVAAIDAASAFLERHDFLPRDAASFIDATEQVLMTRRREHRRKILLNLKELPQHSRIHMNGQVSIRCM